MFSVFLVLCISGYTFAQVSKLGKCPDMKAIPNFDIDKFLGTWNVVEVYREIPTYEGKCYHFDFTRDENRTIHLIQDFIGRSNGVRNRVPGIINEPKPNESGEINFKFLSKVKSQFTILDTDYVSYAVIYYCFDGRMKNHYETLLIFTRDQNPPDSTVAKYVEYTEKHNFERKNFLKIKQEDCELRPSK